ncbi:hypothetical protein E1211_30540 [Micromonospora sp. 15K316]|uniref:hypothetical protein n=1 Tax=Micromonospora sp. 15K316 TaxID=2530376 RepID=UPI0010435271|nr:hypothetical protein [Micromonospora sp. 15K316]TDC25946.1 hypothetical protein E1211_30540 [Micromonospora sp. 15K316]
MAEATTHHQQIGRIGGLRRAALRTNEEGRKAAAQAARMARYDAQVPADITDETERARIRALLLRADMAELARRSAVKRRRTHTPA